LWCYLHKLLFLLFALRVPFLQWLRGPKYRPIARRLVPVLIHPHTKFGCSGCWCWRGSGWFYSRRWGCWCDHRSWNITNKIDWLSTNQNPWY
jgi:hypothetical protein